ncbi:MAG: hypothetical protein ACRDRY_14270, partial [Pseudonocardiaceae bacterium]
MAGASVASVLQRREGDRLVPVAPASTLPASVLPASVLRARLDAPGGRPPFPVVEPLAPLLPGGGLRRGSVVAVQGSTALLLALLAAASAQGAWVAVVGV